MLNVGGDLVEEFGTSAYHFRQRGPLLLTRDLNIDAGDRIGVVERCEICYLFPSLVDLMAVMVAELIVVAVVGAEYRKPALSRRALHAQPIE